MMQFLNYSSVITEGRKKYLSDERTISQRCGQAARVETQFQDIKKLLSENDFPDTREWVEAIVVDGSDGLRRCMVADTEKALDRMQTPAFLHDHFKDAALESVPVEVWDDCDRLRASIARESDGLPLVFVWEETVLDLEAIKHRVTQGCRREITEHDRNLAARVWELSREIRKMELDGINAIELVTKYARREDEPSDLEAATNIVTRRHAPGVLTPVDINAIAKTIQRDGQQQA